MLTEAANVSSTNTATSNAVTLRRKASFNSDVKTNSGNYYNVDINAVTPTTGPTRFARNRHKRRSKTLPSLLPSLLSEIQQTSVASVKSLAKMFELKLVSELRPSRSVLLSGCCGTGYVWTVRFGEGDLVVLYWSTCA